MATANREAGKKYSKYHPLHPCTVCCLCGKSCAYFSHYGGWSESEKDFLKMHWDMELEPSSCICVAHQKEAKRSHPPGYTPKWSKNVPQLQDTTKTCMYPSCSSTMKLITPSFAPISELTGALQMECDEATTFLLCSKHYQELYRQFTSRPCSSCFIKPKLGTCFTRHCPNPDIINDALYGGIGEEADMLSATDYICLSCYKSHMEIIKSYKHVNHLRDMIEIWKSALSDATDFLTIAVLHAVLYVAHEIENQRAVLLPDVSKLFLKKYLELNEVDSEGQEHTLESKEGTVKFTARWLLKQIKVYLHSHMDSTCVHKKFGTLLYRKGGDLLTSLSWALGSSTNNSDEVNYQYHPDQSKIPTSSETLKDAGDIINDILHSEINRLSNINLATTVEQFNFNEEIDKINPLLWLFLESITRTVKQRNGGKEDNSHVKKLRRYYIYCLLMYTANTQQPTALHTILADTVEMCGGSEKLVKIFNQFGIVSSCDKLDRFATDTTSIQRSKTIWDDLTRNTLTISSVDNFDMLQSHASVYCGDQSRSYHGTTVQIVQPKPSIHFDENETAPTTLTAAKRKLDSSPAHSPHKLGKVGPKRPRTLKPRSLAEQLQAAKVQNVASLENTTMVSLIEAHPTMKGFLELPNEKARRESLESKMCAYILLRQQLSNGITDRILLDFKELYAYSTQGSIDISNIYYMEIVDENPDSSDTMRHVSELLLSTADHKYQNGYVVLTGDGKTYQHLMEIKQTYGNALTKLLIFPGDWHTLYNFQPVLIKIYYHAGLKELAQASGFKGETLSSLENCSNFKRTHHFLLQAWQAIYRAMLAAFKSNFNSELPEVTLNEDTTIHNVLNIAETLLHDNNIDKQFKSFLSQLSEKDDTWLFWYRFVFRDCLSYIQLYLAIRCQNWDLRTSALKSMAPLFTAYDRTTYQRLIPYHLADLQKFPPFILEKLKQCFALSINGGKGHAIAIDEAHEMCVNKDMKMAITHPTKSYLQKMSLFLRFRITSHKNLLCQVFPRLKNTPKVNADIFSGTPEMKEREENIISMYNVIQEKSLLPTSLTSNRGLVNVFSNIMASPQQNFDLMNFMAIGSQNLENFIKYHILKIPSTNAPVRQHKLLTMATPKKVSKRAMNQKEKEMKQINKCLRLRLAWCNRTGESYDPTNEQYSLYPRAIADENGCPVKGSKSVWTNKLKTRYKEVVIDKLPTQWTPDAVIIDGMFIINCKPLRTSKNMAEYSLFLFRRFLVPQFQDQVHEIHLLFDTPSSSEIFNPKTFEQKRRDKGKESASHKHEAFTPTTKVPTNWRSYIDCRQCKRSIIEAIGLCFLQSVRLQLRHGQTVYLSGCFPAAGYSCTYQLKGEDNLTGKHPLPKPASNYKSNCDEADLRIWRHVAQTSASHILVYSPDTDIYNIGLSLLSRFPSKDIIVQLNLFHALTNSYLHLNNLVNALELDPDLANLPRMELANILQMLFIVSGCDYISFFAGYGKAAFFNTFFQHASFITGQQSQGLLSDIMEHRKEIGFLAFIRLIGTLYFKKYYAAIVSLEGVETPQQLFHAQESSPDSTAQNTHLLWYNCIRKIVSDRITDEKERMPSHTSMWRHWIRSCWVAQMWSNSSEEDVQGPLPSPEQCGWKKHSDGSYTLDWECPEVERKVQNTINFLTKGCSCKKGCLSKRCSCKKNGHHCGPGCQCQNCGNVTPMATSKVSAVSDLMGGSGQSDLVEHESIDDSVVSQMDGETSDESGTEASSCDSDDNDTENVETEIISDIYDEINNFSIEF